MNASMSSKLLNYSIKFALGSVSPEIFSAEFFTRWTQERVANILELYPPNVSEALSTIFCLVDLFEPEPDRAPYELDGPALVERVSVTLRNAGLL